MNIDGVEIELTKRGNHIDLLCTDVLSAFIDEIAFRFTNDMTINELHKTVSGTNVFRIMDAFFHDKAYNYWKSEYVRHFENDKYEYKSVFKKVFGFVHTKNGENNPLTKEVKQFACKYRTTHSKKFKIAKSSDFAIEYISQNNNITTYRINEKFFDLCLAGRKEMKNPANILIALTSIQNGLNNQNEALFKSGISSFGELASQNLIALLFKNEAKKYFIDIAMKRIHLLRELLYPVALLKEYFGSYRTPYYRELLGELELLLPSLNAYLIESNIDVIATDNVEWKLYENDAAVIRRYSINFRGSPSLISEVQAFLRAKVKKYINSCKPYAQYLSKIGACLLKGINIFCDELDIHLGSISDLTTFDIQELQAYLAQESDFAIKTQRNILVFLRALYNFISSQNKKPAASPFKNLILPMTSVKNTPHIIPVSKETLRALKNNLKKLPVYIQLAFLLCIVTAARANSICLLTTDCLKKSGKGYFIRVYNYKTEEYLILQGKCPYLSHKLPDNLYFELIEYINQTKDLRSQLESPYLFVYRQANHRTDTLRKPSVLDKQAFRYEMKKLLEAIHLYDENGIPVTCNFRNIRAEVGRAMFADGKTENEVAAKLGNTPIIARSHYNTMYPEDEAELYSRHYKDTIEKKIRNRIEAKWMAESHSVAEQPSHKELYGVCNYKNDCGNKNTCHSCQQRIVCKSHSGKGGNI